MQMQKVYRTAMYERLSKEDGENVQSESISIQKQMLEDYCKCRDELIPVKHYTDDGFSGVRFDRPAFLEMMNDIENAWIDCIVVKDLSRLGRDYIALGEYLERVFPRLGIRFIAINDKIDRIDGDYSILLPLANLFNAQYAKDISAKVRSAIAAKQQSGCFTGAYPPFGYCRDKQNRHQLLIDQKAAAVVRRIYTMYLSGMGKTAIASALNREGILSPSQYKLRSRAEKHDKQISSPWSIYAVDRILNDSVYAGNLIAGKTTGDGVCGKRRLLPREQQTIVRGTHTAIIEESVWNSAQKMLAEKRIRVFDSSRDKGLFSGVLFCGICGSGMIPVNSRGKRLFYCRRYKTSGPSACYSHHIGEESLKQAVLSDFNSQLYKIKGLNLLCESAAESAASRLVSGNISKRLAKLSADKKKIYEDYKDGILDLEQYYLDKNKFDKEILGLKDELEEMREKSRNARKWLQYFCESGKLTVLDRTTVLTVIEKIIVRDSGAVEIWYKWKCDK